LATEAATAVLDFAQEKLGLDRVIAVIQPENVASRRVAERIGMSRETSVPYKNFGIVDLFVRRPATPAA
jgi:ribosomal-protein-alanine N-acetyltransferase